MSTAVVDTPVPATQQKLTPSQPDGQWRVSIHAASGLLLVVNRLVVLEDHGYRIRFRAIPAIAMGTGTAVQAVFWNQQDENICREPVRQGPAHVVSPPGILHLTDLNIIRGVSIVDVGRLDLVYHVRSE